ncbi:hypothetical protein A8A57_22095 [Lelliottia amnigena]|nr:hypothetical protein A8A57_22095 [Lelliottia amnigena]
MYRRFKGLDSCLVEEKISFLTKGTDIPLNAGMNITAEIKTGSRRVIDYLLSPLQTTIERSFTER